MSTQGAPFVVIGRVYPFGRFCAHFAGYGKMSQTGYGKSPREAYNNLCAIFKKKGRELPDHRYDYSQDQKHVHDLS